MKRILPADVFDALELGAEAFGGIGGGSYYEPNKTDYGVDFNRPMCAIGMARFVEGQDGWNHSVEPGLETTLRAAGINGFESDVAVATVNRRLRAASDVARVPFSDWCAELGIVRGET